MGASLLHKEIVEHGVSMSSCCCITTGMKNNRNFFSHSSRGPKSHISFSGLLCRQLRAQLLAFPASSAASASLGVWSLPPSGSQQGSILPSLRVRSPSICLLLRLSICNPCAGTSGPPGRSRIMSHLKILDHIYKVPLFIKGNISANPGIRTSLGGRALFSQPRAFGRILGLGHFTGRQPAWRSVVARVVKSWDTTYVTTCV